MLLVVTLCSAPAPAEAGWGNFYFQQTRTVRPAASDQSWLMDVPEKPTTRPKGKVAVFVFEGDDVYQPMRAAVVRALRRKGLNVTAALRPVDSAPQYRELSDALNLAVYVKGEISGQGSRQSALVHLYSSVTGQRIASAKFSGSTPKIVGAIGRTLWSRSGPAITRACSRASRPRRREHEPLRIEAGTPLENNPSPAEDT